MTTKKTVRSYKLHEKMEKQFDTNEAKKFLESRAEREKERLERERKELLQRAISVLVEEFTGTGTEVYLIGSITQPYRFTSFSDVDIVLKNFQADRFAAWTKLEDKIGRNVEVILFENCPFQDFVVSNGYKVL